MFGLTNSTLIMDSNSKTELNLKTKLIFKSKEYIFWDKMLNKAL
jgi:hypothetical protein